jgi:hypothetical protein
MEERALITSTLLSRMGGVDGPNSLNVLNYLSLSRHAVERALSGYSDAGGESELKLES